jgi:long-chain fatty acid transport protein
MGGTAIGYVDDASAAFHNPAGLQHVNKLSVLGDFSLVLGHVRATPDAVLDSSVTSELVVAPFFMLAGAVRVHEWVSVGLAIFPVASGGAAFEYEPVAGNPLEDATRVVFFEATPVVSLNVPEDLLLPGKLAFGFGYRANLLEFKREKGPPGNPVQLDLDMSGTNFDGYRLGLQWAPSERVSLGAVYRSKIDIEAKMDKGRVYLQEATDATLGFVLPARFGTGVRVNFEDSGRPVVGLAADFEYAFQSQNRTTELAGTVSGRESSLTNVYRWRDAVTARVGAEYRLPALGGEIPFRAGYVYDGPTTNRRYPSAFGTPPTETHSVSFGGGYDRGPWQANFAVARRYGEVTLRESDLAPPTECRFCSFAGDYSIRNLGLYVDVSVDL